MPSKRTLQRARKDRAEGKSGSTQAGEFVREEMDHIREGKHGAKNAKQAIAIGLSKARRAGVDVAPGPGASAEVRRNPRRARASERALKRAPRVAASPVALSRQAHASAEKRRKAGGSNSPSAAAKRAAKTRKRTATKARRAA